MGIVVLVHPLSIAIALVALFGFSFGAYAMFEPAPITPRRLVRGYFAAFIACVLLATAESTINSSSGPWGIGGEHLLVSAIYITYISLFGIAIIGVPAIFMFALFRPVTVPRVLALAVAISLVASVAISVLTIATSSSMEFVKQFLLMVGAHLWVCLFFCFGSTIPWRDSRPGKGETTASDRPNSTATERT